MRRTPWSAFPETVDLKSGTLIGLLRETSKLRENDIHARLRNHLRRGCREWFRDSACLRSELLKIGFWHPREMSERETRTGKPC